MIVPRPARTILIGVAAVVVNKAVISISPEPAPEIVASLSSFVSYFTVPLIRLYPPSASASKLSRITAEPGGIENGSRSKTRPPSVAIADACTLLAIIYL